MDIGEPYDKNFVVRMTYMQEANTAEQQKNNKMKTNRATPMHIFLQNITNKMKESHHRNANAGLVAVFFFH